MLGEDGSEVQLQCTSGQLTLSVKIMHSYRWQLLGELLYSYPAMDSKLTIVMGWGWFRLLQLSSYG